MIKNNHINCFGIEATSELLWAKWKPGKEYIKNIIVKNVFSKPQRIQYKIPTSKCFSAPSVKSINLAAGKTFSIPITFKPTENVLYTDKLEIISQRGVIEISLKATLSSNSIFLNFPSYVNCGIAIVGSDLQANLSIENIGEYEMPFKIDCLQPFQIFPAFGTLAPKRNTTLKIIFTPLEAKVYKGTFVVNFDSDLSKVQVIEVTGQGKYPSFSIECSCGMECSHDQAIVDFGEQIIGSQIKKNIVISNKLNLPTKLFINRMSGDNHFKIKEKEIILSPLQNVNVQVCFTAQDPDQVFIEYFSFSTQFTGKIKIKSSIKCIAKSLGPKIVFSNDLINFETVESGTCSHKILTIFNISPCTAYFQFQTDNSESIFTLFPSCGVLTGNNQINLKITFKPIFGFNYYRRVPCIIHQQGVKFLDLLGACSTDENEIPLMKDEYIMRYNKHVQRGLSTLSQKNLLKMLENKELIVDEDSCLSYAIPKNTVSFACPYTGNMEEYFNDGYYSSYSTHLPHLSIDFKEINFDYLAALQSSTRVLNAANHTEDIIYIRWISDHSQSFHIVPEILEIEPQKTVSFSVVFCPTSANNFFGAELQGYYCYKYALLKSTVDSRILLPSWYTTLKVQGHSFEPNSEHFVPKFNLDSKNYLMLSVRPSISIYKTMLLHNLGHTPILYSLKNENEIFSQKPFGGLIPVDNFQIFTIKFQPDDSQMLFESNLSLTLNSDRVNDQIIGLKGVIENASFDLSNDGNVFLSPASIGSFSIGNSFVSNMSRLPIKFEIHIKLDDKEMLAVEPSSTLINPLEKIKLEWKFTPKGLLSKYIFKPTVKTWSALEEATVRPISKYFIRVVASSTNPSITSEREFVDLGTVVAGEPTCRYLNIGNNSNCKANFLLLAQEIYKTDMLEDKLFREPTALKFANEKMYLEGRTKGRIDIIIDAKEKSEFQWDISIQMLDYKSELISCLPHYFICSVKANVIFPTFKVTDIYGLGSSKCLSKQNLWKLFNIDRLNSLLSIDPMPEELKYKVPTKISLIRKLETETKVEVELTFNASAIYSEPSIIFLTFQNSNKIPAKWSLLCSTDLQIKSSFKIEENKENELANYEDMLFGNNIFGISEKSGTIYPNCTKCITFAYEHKIVGLNELNLLLKIEYGREILLKLRGTTLIPNVSYLQLIDTKFYLNSVPIGCVRAPVQSFQLYNAGSKSLKYSINEESLNKINIDNYNHKVFECLNPCGFINPTSVHSIEFKFLPLEVKTYKTMLKIRINDVEDKMIEICGLGFDKILFGDVKPTMNADVVLVPDEQKSLIREQLCFLSTEKISFEDMPLYSVKKRLIFLNNFSSQPISFVWKISEQLKQNIKITPEKDMLKPSQSVVCVLTFTALPNPAFFDAHVHCEISDLNELIIYHNRVTKIKEKEIKMANEFTINENNVHFQDSDSGKQVCNMLPAEPQPQVLHLHIVARLHDIHEYFHLYGDVKTTYINKSLINLNENNNIGIREDEIDLINYTLNCIINDILFDEEFQQSCANLILEPVPYFKQFKSDVDLITEYKSSPNDNNNQNKHPNSKLMKTNKKDSDICLEIVSSPKFSRFLDDMLENTIFNILQEAYFGEFNITTRPRLVALPPKASVSN